MVFENLQVKHNKFGLGTVVATQGKYLTVRFNDVEKNFVYPDAFDKYLTLADGTVSDDIKADISVSKSKKEEILEEKQKERIYSMTHGIVIPGKEPTPENEEDDRGYKSSEIEEV